MRSYWFILLLLVATRAGAQDSLRAAWVAQLPPGLQRTQLPAMPYPYRVEEVQFHSAQTGITYGATLTLPAGRVHFPTVVLMSGTGPEDRDYTAYYHKYFWVLADYLTRQGIGVLRVDDRGTGTTTGDFPKASTHDFAEDLLVAVQWLHTRSDIDTGRIGLVGHSEGGIIAPMTYNMAPGTIHFLVLLSPPVVGLRVINHFQSARSFARDFQDTTLAQAQMRLHESIVSRIPEAARDTAALRALVAQALTCFCNQEGSNTVQRLLLHDDESSRYTLFRSYQGFLSPWWQFILPYDPLTDLKKIKCPVLVIFGDKDMQVPPAEDYVLVKQTLPAAETLLLPDVNHFMMWQPEGTPANYFLIKNTLAPTVLKMVGDWLNKQ